MKKKVSLLLCIGFMFLLSSTSVFSQSASHTVTVTVGVIIEVTITGGDLTLQINTATGGGDPNQVTDATTCDLSWTINGDPKKITVETTIGSPTFVLQVEAQNVTGGTGTAPVELSTTAVDFITDISATIGNCDLAYTASAAAADGTGTENHTVTYTLTAG